MITNEMKPTEDQKAKVFMLYAGTGTKVSYSYIFGDSTRYGEDTLIGVFKDVEYEQAAQWALQIQYSNGNLDTIDFDENQAQLILRDLSDISDEDCIEVSKIMGFGNSPKEMGRWFVKDGLIHRADVEPIKYIQLIDLLRQQDYMLPAFGIQNLFESGIAVKQEKK